MSALVEGHKRWLDRRILFAMPVGFLFWIYWCIGFFLLPNTLQSILKNNPRWVFFFVLFGGIVAGSWLVSVGVFRYIVCPLKIFVAWRVSLVENVFDVRGFYRKRMRFLATEVVSIQPYTLPRKQFSSEMGSLLSQPQPNKEMVNWKVTLRSGVSFYLAAEMDKVEELKDLLSHFAALNATP